MVRRVLLPAAVLLAGAMSAADASAQFTGVHHGGLPAIDTGARIRVNIASAHRSWVLGSRAHYLRGTVRAIAPDTLYMQLANVVGQVAVPRSQIRGLELSKGPPSRIASAVHAGSIGVLLSGVQSWLGYAPERSGYNAAWKQAAAGAAIGFGFGAWWGWRHPYEGWRAAEFPDDLME